MPQTPPFFDRLLEILPRHYLNYIAAQHAGVEDALPIVRTSLKIRILAADSLELRRELAIWVAKQLLPDNVTTLDLR